MVLSFTAVDYEGVTKDLGSSHNRKAENMAHNHISGSSHIEKLFHQNKRLKQFVKCGLVCPFCNLRLVIAPQQIQCGENLSAREQIK